MKGSIASRITDLICRLVTILFLSAVVEARAQKVISKGAVVTGAGSYLGALTDGLTPRNHVFNLPNMQIDRARLWYGSGAGDSFVIDLGSQKTIDAFRLWGDMSFGAGYVIDKFTIERSSNGSTFFPVVSQYSARLIGWLAPVLVDFPGTVSARYLRFTVNHVESDNPQGASLSEIEVLSDELAAPVITQQPQSFIGAPGQPITLEAAAEGRSIQGWQWRRNGTLIPNATTSILVVTNTVGIGTGVYQAAAVNAAGSGLSRNAFVGAFWIGNDAGTPRIEVDWVPGATFGIQTNPSPSGVWQFWTNVTPSASRCSVPIQSTASGLFFKVSPPNLPPSNPGGGGFL